MINITDEMVERFQETYHHRMLYWNREDRYETVCPATRAGLMAVLEMLQPEFKQRNDE